jgi:pyruvate kinase
MIENTRAAGEAVGRPLKVVMDLPGPKIRTGPIGDGPRVVRIKPERDRLGRVWEPGRAVLVAEGSTPPVADDRILPVPMALLEAVRPGDELHFGDTRGKPRVLTVTEVGKTLTVARRTLEMARVECTHTIYLEAGTPLTLLRTGQVFRMGELPPLRGRFWLRPGDHLILHRRDEPGRPPERDEDGRLLVPASVACTWPHVFERVRPGEPVAFDDGSITGVVREVRGDEMVVDIVHALPTGTKLKADKGINFPASVLGFEGLTGDDRAHLPFVAANADILNLSFVHTAADVEELLDELERLEAPSGLGILLKIETMASIANLVPILLTAMRVKPVGIMIARGDLAVESGWHYMGIAQEAVLTLCRAAHVPTVWASQVLESLAKTGVPSRAEITDVVMGERAECVMLNKGRYVDGAVELTAAILRNQETLLARRRQLFGIPRARPHGTPLTAAAFLDPRWRGPDTPLEALLADVPGEPAVGSEAGGEG